MHRDGIPRGGDAASARGAFPPPGEEAPRLKTGADLTPRYTLKGSGRQTAVPFVRRPKMME